MKNQREQKVRCTAIKSKRIACKLRKEGFPIKSVEPDRDHPERDVYVFEMTLGFQDALDKILEKRYENKEKWHQRKASREMEQKKAIHEKNNKE